jgi:hypothetical protein
MAAKTETKHFLFNVKLSSETAHKGPPPPAGGRPKK